MQKMVESVRQSIGVGIPYEIVLVDGGSTDGTIEWCKSQPDIVLIEQGKLLGAIKAFNEGLFAARGRYCIVGNDDVLYIDETLPQALSFMHDNPEVGVGAFFQDRDHPGQFDISRMPAILDGKQVMQIYGQVCIVPKWLGDEVGWWGNYPELKTYGGDNNLSSFVLEKGYRVTAVPCACISDMKIEDALRRANNDDYIQTSSTRSGHPDSNNWGRIWTRRNGMCGPIISTTPYKPNPLERKMRFLYLPIYERGYEVQKHSKRGLRDALANYGLVYEYDWLEVAAQQSGRYMINYLRDLIDTWKPDVLITQIHSPDPGMFNAQTVWELHKEYPNLTWVNWNGDYHPEDLLTPLNLEMAKRFDLQCVVTTMVREAYAKAGVNWMYWQIGYERSDAEPNGSTPHHDVVFLANGYSGARLTLGSMLKKLPRNVGIYGSWGTGVQPNGANLYDFDAGQRLYRAAKLSIGDNQWGDTAVGFVSNRLFQALAAGGAMLLHQRVPDLDKLLGLENGKHYIEWIDNRDLIGKIGYYLEHEDERQMIAKTGTEFVREHHSFDARVSELMGVLV
jgi:glycosyltransferase involved in cell wall biosynthesis